MICSWLVGVSVCWCVCWCVGLVVGLLICMCVDSFVAWCVRLFVC